MCLRCGWLWDLQRDLPRMIESTVGILVFLVSSFCGCRLLFDVGWRTVLASCVTGMPLARWWQCGVRNGAQLLVIRRALFIFMGNILAQSGIAHGCLPCDGCSGRIGRAACASHDLKLRRICLLSLVIACGPLPPMSRVAMPADAEIRYSDSSLRCNRCGGRSGSSSTS